MKYKNRGDVQWYLPHHKRPFAYSSVATKDLIEAFGEDGLTIQQIHDSINYDVDAKKIMKHYIDNGYKNIKWEAFKNVQK